MAGTRRLTVEILGDPKSVTGAFAEIEERSGKMGKAFDALSVAGGMAFAGLGAKALEFGKASIEAASNLKETESKVSVIFGTMAEASAVATEKVMADKNELTKAEKGYADAVEAAQTKTGKARETAAAKVEEWRKKVESAQNKVAANEKANAEAHEQFLAKGSKLSDEYAKQIEKFASGAAKSYGQSKQQAMDAAATFATFGKAAGMNGQSLVDFSTKLTGLSSDMASFSNTSPQEAIEAIGAALRGESEPIRKYGVMLNDATLKAEAMKMGIYNGTGALSQQQKVMAAYQAILNQTKDAQGDFSRTSDGLANKQRIQAAQMENLKVQLGEKLLPVQLAVTSATLKMATAAADLIPVISKAVGVVIDLGQALGEKLAPGVKLAVGFMGDVAEAIGSGIDKVRDLWSDKWDTIAKVGDTIWNVGILTPIKGYAILLQGQLKAVWELMHGDWRGAWEAIRNTGQQLFDLAPDSVKAVMTGALSHVKEWISDILPDVTGKWSEIWDGLKLAAGDDGPWGVVRGAMTGALGMVKDWVGDIAGPVGAMWASVWGNLKDTFNNPDAWPAVMSAVVDTLKQPAEWVWNISTGLWAKWTAVWNGLKEKFSGVWDGDSGVGAVVKTAIGKVVEVFQAIENAISGIIKGIPNIHWPEPPDWMKSIINKGGNLVEGVASFFGGGPASASPAPQTATPNPGSSTPQSAGTMPTTGKPGDITIGADGKSYVYTGSAWIPAGSAPVGSGSSGSGGGGGGGGTGTPASGQPDPGPVADGFSGATAGASGSADSGGSGIVSSGTGAAGGVLGDAGQAGMGLEGDSAHAAEAGVGPTSPSGDRLPGGWMDQTAAYRHKALLDAIAAVESGGGVPGSKNYKAYNAGSKASGAYQFVPKTWGGYSDFTKSVYGKTWDEARDAPADVQDAVALQHLAAGYTQHFDDPRKAAYWWFLPAAIRDAGRRDVVPPGNVDSPNTYADKVLKMLGSSTQAAGTGADNGGDYGPIQFPYPQEVGSGAWGQPGTDASHNPWYDRMVGATGQGRGFRINEKVKPRFEGLFNDLGKYGYKLHETFHENGNSLGWIQTYNRRPIGGTNSWSLHSFGVAADINPDVNQWGSTKWDIPTNLARGLARKWGLRWGGDYAGKKDPMHFEYPGSPKSLGYRDGGYVEKLTYAMMGEAGAEAVLPLTNPARMAELMSDERIANPVMVALLDGVSHPVTFRGDGAATDPYTIGHPVNFRTETPDPYTVGHPVTFRGDGGAVFSDNVADYSKFRTPTPTSPSGDQGSPVVAGIPEYSTWGGEPAGGKTRDGGAIDWSIQPQPGAGGGVVIQVDSLIGTLSVVGTAITPEQGREIAKLIITPFEELITVRGKVTIDGLYRIGPQ